MALAANPSGPASNDGLPGGEVTFLFTDIEGSTQHLRENEHSYRQVLVSHRVILRDCVGERGGFEIDAPGDGMLFVFPEALSALQAAVAAQREIADAHWPDDRPVRVRMGLHTGYAEPENGSYVAMAVHQGSRVVAAAHGGQILASDATARAAGNEGFIEDSGSGRVALTPVGDFVLRDFDGPCSLWQVCDPHTLSVVITPRARTVAGHNIPNPVSSFLGRHQDLHALAAQLDQQRLVTLVGPGGAGKTRLACEVARRPEQSKPDGVCLVRLATTKDPAVAAADIAAALGLRLQPGRDGWEALGEQLAEKNLLLLLDNCEQIRAEISRGCAHLLATCPQVKVLATSREALGVEGESLFQVKPFEVPPRTAEGLRDVDRYEAVRLFAARAATHRPDFELDEHNAADVASICRQLDGMPLAIELAAARLRSLNLADIARRLDDRLSLLGATTERATPHHQTMRATIEWSYDLLGPEERTFFSTLAVFPGTFDLAAAERVCSAVGVGMPQAHPSAAVLDHLEALIEKNLLQPVRIGANKPVRYSMLQTVQQYGEEKLRSSDIAKTVLDAHATHFLEVAIELARQAQGDDEADAVDRLDTDFDNVRAAFRWLFDSGDFERTRQLLMSLLDDMILRERFEIGQWAGDLLGDKRCQDHSIRAVALAVSANSALVEGRIDDAAQLALDALAAESVDADNQTWLSRSILGLLSSAGLAAGSPEVHFAAMEEMTARTGSNMPMAVSLFDQALVCTLGNRCADALPVAERLRALGRRSGNPSVMAMGLLSIGRSLGVDEPLRARAALREAMAQADAVGSSLLSHQARRALAELDDSEEKTSRAALRALAEDLSATRDPSQQMQTMLSAIRHLQQVGLAALAVTVCGFLDGTPLRASGMFRDSANATRDALDGQDYWNAWERGASMRIGQLVEAVVAKIGGLP